MNTGPVGAAMNALDDAHAAVDVLLRADLGAGSSDNVVAVVREAGRLRNRLAALDHRLIGELEARGVAFDQSARSTAALMCQLLRIGRGEATARVRAAQACAARVALTGQVVPPPYAVLAAAQASGDVSPGQASVIVRAVELLPDHVQAEVGEQVETDLVKLAAQFDPRGLEILGQRMRDHHDPDGRYRDLDYRAKHRSLQMHRRGDGSARLTGEATAELVEHLEIVFNGLAAPEPAVDGSADPRTAVQRRHDALLSGLRSLVRSGGVPDSHGLPSTLVMHVDADAWRDGSGVATTSHGAIVPVGEARRWVGADVALMTVAMNVLSGVGAHSGLHRLFRPAQRLALAARDIGCTFPGCDQPAPRCQAHHVTAWADGGVTTIDNGALVCDHHHRQAIAHGWTTRMINHRPAWIPPAHVDPARQPRYNHVHDPWRRPLRPDRSGRPLTSPRRE